MPRQPNNKLPAFLRVFTATLHDWRASHVKKIKKAVPNIFNWIIIGYENGDNGDTPHLQMYGQCTKQMRGSAIKKVFGTKRVHLDYRNGTHRQARRYCKKEGIYEELGVARTEKNSQNNILVHNSKIAERLKKVADLAHTGASFRQLQELDIAICARHMKWVDRNMLIAVPATRWNLKVSVHYGLPDAGKSYYCRKQYPGIYVPPVKNAKNGSEWFDGYDGQKAVLFEDFSGKMLMDSLLRYLDVYAVLVPVKTSHVWLQAEHICITTNVDPDIWYDYFKRQDSKIALFRRIHEWWKHEKVVIDGEVHYLAQKFDTCSEMNNPTLKLKVPVSIIESDDELIIEDSPPARGVSPTSAKDLEDGLTLSSDESIDDSK